MLEMEKRLEDLSLQVKSQRRKGFVHEWPEVIYKEAVFLLNTFAVRKISTATSLAESLLYRWKSERRDKKVVFKKHAEDKILVTRILPKDEYPIQKSENPVAIVMKEGVEFKIYCKHTAEKIAERFLV